MGLKDDEVKYGDTHHVLKTTYSALMCAYHFGIYIAGLHSGLGDAAPAIIFLRFQYQHCSFYLRSFLIMAVGYKRALNTLYGCDTIFEKGFSTDLHLASVNVNNNKELITTSHSNVTTDTKSMICSTYREEATTYRIIHCFKARHVKESVL